MNKGLIKTILVSAAIGFFLIWIFEVNRTDMKSSYWLLLMSVTCLLIFQYYFRVKGIVEEKADKNTAVPARRNVPSTKKKKK